MQNQQWFSGFRAIMVLFFLIVILSGGTYYIFSHQLFSLIPSKNLEETQAILVVGTSTHADKVDNNIDDGFEQVKNSDLISDMSRYTDSDFGFSFYYPQNWQVVKKGNVVSIINPKDFDEYSQYDKHREWINIKEFSSDKVESQGLFSRYLYTYDSNTQQWMYDLNMECGESESSCNSHSSGVATSIMVGTTMGEYPVFPGGRIHGSGNVLIPLSSNKMLEIKSGTGASSFVMAFARTVTPSSVLVDRAKLNTTINSVVNDHYYLQQKNYEESQHTNNTPN
jgi:hypothetical protein